MVEPERVVTEEACADRGGGSLLEVWTETRLPVLTLAWLLVFQAPRLSPLGLLQVSPFLYLCLGVIP